MKTIINVFILSVVVFLSGCGGKEDSPPYGPTSCGIGLTIADGNGESLLTGKLEVKGDYITSPYKLTATCNNKTIEIKKFAYSPEISVLGLYVNLHDFNYMEMEGYTGTVTYRMQLPTVFDDNRETVIDVKWRVKEKTVINIRAEIEEVYINGTKVDVPEPRIVGMVVDE